MVLGASVPSSVPGGPGVTGALPAAPGRLCQQRLLAGFHPSFFLSAPLGPVATRSGQHHQSVRMRVTMGHRGSRAAFPQGSHLPLLGGDRSLLGRGGGHVQPPCPADAGGRAPWSGPVAAAQMQHSYTSWTGDAVPGAGKKPRSPGSGAPLPPAQSVCAAAGAETTDVHPSQLWSQTRGVQAESVSAEDLLLVRGRTFSLCPHMAKGQGSSAVTVTGTLIPSRGLHPHDLVAPRGLPAPTHWALGFSM